MRKPLLALTGLLIAMLLILAGCAPAPTGSIRGRIVYYTNGQNVKVLKGLAFEPAWSNTAVQGATVSVAGRSTTTDVNGYFMVSGVPARTQTVFVSHPDFRDGIRFNVDVVADTINDISGDISMPMGHYLAVGVGTYINGNKDLDHDGQIEIPNLTGPPIDVSNIETNLFPAFQGHKVVLRDTLATKTNIINELYKARDLMDPNDFFIFYYSGHGWSSYYDNPTAARVDAIVPADFNPLSATDDRLLTDKELADIIKTFPNPSRVIVIIDACNSGSFIDGTISTRAIVDTKALKYTGATVMTASRNNELAYDSDSGGIFTRGIIEALTSRKDEADTSDDSQLTTQEVYNYAKDYAVDYANYIKTNFPGKYETPQTPTLQLGGNPILLRW